MLKKQKNFLLQVIQKKREDAEKHLVRAVAFKKAILRGARRGVAIIGEIKFASPTHPRLGSPSQLLPRAKAYKEAGVDAISIITEKHFFKGDISYVSAVKKHVTMPVLQKDFVISEDQIYEARAHGADALLFIARLVSEAKLQAFVKLAIKLGIEPVVEVFDEKDLKRAITTKTLFIAVNARDLDTFIVDVEKACELLQKIPLKFIRLGFSGVASKKEVVAYKKAGVEAVLVGTRLMKAKDIKGFLGGLQ